MSKKGDSRTATATPGLLKIGKDYKLPSVNSFARFTTNLPCPAVFTLAWYTGLEKAVMSVIRMEGGI